MGEIGLALSGKVLQVDGISDLESIDPAVGGSQKGEVGKIGLHQSEEELCAILKRQVGDAALGEMRQIHPFENTGLDR